MSPSTTLPTEERHQGRGHHHPTQNLGFCPETTTNTKRDRGICQHTSMVPPRRGTTHAGGIVVGPKKSGQGFHPYRRSSPCLRGLGQCCHCSLTPQPPPNIVVSDIIVSIVSELIIEIMDPHNVMQK
jgi:hypothetical protein